MGQKKEDISNFPQRKLRQNTMNQFVFFLLPWQTVNHQRLGSRVESFCGARPVHL